MTIISKVAGGLSLFSCLRDIHKTGVIYSNREYQKSAGDSYISCSVGTQKANRVSYRDAERKNWLLRNNFFAGASETWGRVKGYFKGVVDAASRYIPNIALSAIALSAKRNIIANMSAVGLAVVEIYDFIKNSSGIFDRSDYLK